jgi:hypothetical protein
LRGNAKAAVIDADLTQPEQVLDSPDIHKFIDFNEPIGLLMVAVFHFVADDKRPSDIVAKYRSVLPAGSFLALSHLTADQMPGESDAVVEAMKNSRDPMYFRSYGEVVPLFDGFDLVPPGVVNASQWHADGIGDDQDGIYVGVGRKS